jgi:hypothetical protein
MPWSRSIKGMLERTGEKRLCALCLSTECTDRRRSLRHFYQLEQLGFHFLSGLDRFRIGTCNLHFRIS